MGNFRIEKLSPKQKTVFNWWLPGAATARKDAIICDGAVRSGKTLVMGVSFFCWAMSSFNEMKFGLCGKTIVSLRRNVVDVILPVLRDLGFTCSDCVSKNILTVSFGGNSNTFHLFGGKDEGSAALVQGVTFAGVLFDEVALQPRSFVEQACARCSVEGSKFWFNCNPESPAHWFYREWIKKAKERNALYLHFRMEDNPSLSKEIRRRYERMYSGAFYERFILGKWTAAQGAVYDFFDETFVRPAPHGKAERYYVSCDYGTANPASFGIWGLWNGVWFRIREFYFASRVEGFQKTDEEYAEELIELCRGCEISGVVVDPSAASFIETLRRRGMPVMKAKNDVLSGIRLTADMLKNGGIVICDQCRDAIREFSLYVWDENSAGDVPKKENDHSMDEIRYFVSTVAADNTEYFTATFVER